ncbi:MAG: hypothetical protein P9M14_16410 [Candidatus Alcyoniella australis]|nr:hypothetical protein [Candidatus Alcyoniella australis]
MRSVRTLLSILMVFALCASAAAAEQNDEASSVADVAALIAGLDPVVLEEGGSGSFLIAADYDGSQEIDIKHHWNSDADGFGRVIAVINWEQPDQGEPWEIELSVGSGFCPHRGKVYGERIVSKKGPLVLDVAPEGGFPPSTLLFVHGRPMNADKHKGQHLKYRVEVYLLD